MDSIKAYKLFRIRANGTLGSLFIGRKATIPLGQWLEAQDIPTKGYAHRPGWHCTLEPIAPHLSKKSRVWCEVEIADWKEHPRPENQGGVWFIAQKMKVNRILEAI
jgi:hypothetical protein